MEKFQEIPLKDLYDELVMGQSPNSETYNDEKKGLPFVQGNADMDNGFPEIRIYTSDPKKLSQKGDILLSVRAPVGDLFKNNIGELAIGRGLCAIKIKDKYLNKYIHHYLNWDKKQFLKLQQGTTFTEIGKREVRNLKIPIPNTPNEQTAIATILSKVDETIEATKNSIKAAEKLKKGLMQNLLTGKLKPDGTWRTEDEFYEDEKFGKVPVGWEVARVKDYGFVQTGKTPPTAEPKVFSEMENEKRYPFVTPGDLGKSKYISKAERYVTKKGIGYSFKVPQNSVFVVCIGSTIGKIGIAKNESCTNQQINTLIANDSNSSEFFYYMMVFRKPHFKEIAGINATPQINKSGFNKYKLLRPIEKEEQIQIANKLKTMDENVGSKNTKIKILQRLKKSLMQNLLTGKVRLPSAFIAQFEIELEGIDTTTIEQ